MPCINCANTFDWTRFVADPCPGWKMFCALVNCEINSGDVENLVSSSMLAWVSLMNGCIAGCMTLSCMKVPSQDGMAKGTTGSTGLPACRDAEESRRVLAHRLHP